MTTRDELERRALFSREQLVDVLAELDANASGGERDRDDCQVFHLDDGDAAIVRWAVELARDGAWPGPPSEREVEAIRRRAEQAYAARRRASPSSFDDDDTLWIERLGNGTALFLRDWSYGGLQLCIGEIGRQYYDDTWYYDAEHRRSAWRDVLTWKGLGEPCGWTRHPASGRRRPDGTRASEFIRP